MLITEDAKLITVLPVKNPPVEPVALQPECQFQRRHPHRGFDKSEIRSTTRSEAVALISARSEASALNNDQNPKVLMTKTVTCCFIGRKYLFGTFSHLIFEFVSIFDIRILRLWVSLHEQSWTIPPAKQVDFGHKLKTSLLTICRSSTRKNEWKGEVLQVLSLPDFINRV